AVSDRRKDRFRRIAASGGRLQLRDANVKRFWLGGGLAGAAGCVFQDDLHRLRVSLQAHAQRPAGKGLDVLGSDGLADRLPVGAAISRSSRSAGIPVAEATAFVAARVVLVLSHGSPP